MKFVLTPITLIFFYCGCSKIMDKPLPLRHQVHFPYAMAISDKKLYVAASSLDGKFDYGRLIGMDLDVIKANLEEKKPISYSEVNETNLLIHENPSSNLLLSDNFLALANKKTNMAYFVPKNAAGNFLCPDEAKIDECMKVKSLKLSSNNPGSSSIIEKHENDLFYIFSYLSSDYLSIINLTNKQAKIIYNISLFKIINKMIDKKINKEQYGFTVKKVFSTKNYTYVALEKHKKITKIKDHDQNGASYVFFHEPSGLYLVKISNTDLIAGNFAKSALVIGNYEKDFNINGAADLFVDKEDRYLYLLGSSPEILYKIEIAQNHLLSETVVCQKPGIMAVLEIGQQLVVPCLKDNIAISYSMEDLTLMNTSPYLGRMPGFAVADEARELIFISILEDGIVKILDLSLKNVLGHLFSKAPSNRIGS